MGRAIVIGTGAGGLTAAIELAQQGHPVVALDAAEQFGGFLNPYTSQRYSFDVGIHYLGLLEPDETLHMLYERLGLDAGELFCPMDQDVFDLVRFPDFELRIPVGLDRYQDRLASAFPEDRRDINRFFKLLSRVARLADTISQIPLRRRRLADLRALPGFPIAVRWLQRSFGDLLTSAFRNPRLRSVIAAQCGDYGQPPSRAPALLGLGLILYFAEGAFFPRGGSGRLRDALVARGRALGVRYRPRATVTTIHVNSQRVTGVSLESGERLEADAVISTIDPTLTYGRLLRAEPLPPRLRAKVDSTEPSLGSLCLLFGMRRDLSEHGLGAFNVWDYADWDLEAPYRKLFANEMQDGSFYLLAPNSLKDDTRSLAPDGCSTLEVITLCPYQPFARWDGLPATGRGVDYEEFKRSAADRLRSAVERNWPGLIGDVEVEEVTSPLTNISHAGSVQGGTYGPASTLAQFGPNGFSYRTPIDGLFLAGAGVYGGGVAPCQLSGLLAALAATKALSDSDRKGVRP